MLGQTDRQTDGRTRFRCIDSADKCEEHLHDRAQIESAVSLVADTSAKYRGVASVCACVTVAPGYDYKVPVDRISQARRRQCWDVPVFP